MENQNTRLPFVPNNLFCIPYLPILLLTAFLTANCSGANADYGYAEVKVCRDTTSALARTLGQFADNMGNSLNGTMIIAMHDTILVERAYGFKQLYKEPTGYGNLSWNRLAELKSKPSNQMTMATLFDLASVSKQFTAAAVLKLCADGKLRLTDSLGKYYPGFPYPKITVKQLLTHTSGIPEYFNFPFNIYDTTVFVTNRQLIKALMRQRYPVMFARGSRFKYVNTNYAILADLVSQVTGETFESYVREQLWKPAGMKDAMFFTELVDPDAELKRKHVSIAGNKEYVTVSPKEEYDELHLARGHWRSGALAQYDRLNSILGDKGIYASAEDLVKWTSAFYIKKEIIPAEWVEEVIKCQNRLTNGTLPAEWYGYGVRMEEKDQHGLTVYHGGLWDGFHNVWLYRPSDGLTIVFLSNYYNRAHIGKCNEVLDLVDSVKHNR